MIIILVKKLLLVRVAFLLTDKSGSTRFYDIK
jgi:hypothetical protein